MLWTILCTALSEMSRWWCWFSSKSARPFRNALHHAETGFLVITYLQGGKLPLDFCWSLSFCAWASAESHLPAIAISSHAGSSAGFADICNYLWLCGKDRGTLRNGQCPKAELFWMQHYRPNPVTLPQPCSAYRTKRFYATQSFSELECLIRK